ncbi:hypothetical protein ACIP4U_39315 [Streptomyces caelestis]|uniref:hypothetical protein n=1 Tax=Streptomyces caelestis TaxID=36816 RepID=UPI003824B06F
MAADRLPDEVREFAQYLDGLLARLDPSGGWCAVFWQRDPEGMRACLDGREMPPWDVVEALLQDLAGQYGPGGAGPETERARSLHAAALAAYDTRPGGRDALGDRLDVMLREQKYAAERQADLTRLLATAATREEADALRLDLAWAHDDHERATARCAELRARMADLDRRERGVSHGVWGDGDGRGGGIPWAVAGVSGGPGAAEDPGSDGRPGPRDGGPPDGDGAWSDDEGAWSGAWRRPNTGGFAAADGGSRTGSGRGTGPGAATDGGQSAWGRGSKGDRPAADSGPGYGGEGPGSGSGRGYAGDGPAADSGRMRSGPGGSYDSGTPATPWYRDEPTSVVTGAAGRHDPRHADADAEAERRADLREAAAGGPSGAFAAPDGRGGVQDGEYAAGRAAPREAGAGGASGAFAARGGRADVRDGEYAAGGAASGEAAAGGASGVFAARVRRADDYDGEYAGGRAASGEAAAGGTSGVFAARGGRADAQDREYPVGRPGPRQAAVDGAAGVFQAPDQTDRTSREAAAGTPGPFAARVGRADARHGEYPAGRAASQEGAAAGTPGPFANPAPADHEPVTPSPVTPKQRKRRRGSARFAGVVEEDAAPVVVPSAAVPLLPEPAPVTGRRTPRGARFAGAADEVGEERAAQSRGVAAGVAERREVVRAVEALARLRKEGRSGEAHALLVEATSWAPARFPLLADELERAGLGAHWQTLLWEAASLPAGRLVAAADALGAAGRAADGQQILRQGVARPPGEIGEAVLGLVAEGRHREVRALLDAYVRVRTPEEAARSAEPGPQTLVPLLLEAAQGVSDERRWDLLHALRVAGFPA